MLGSDIAGVVVAIGDGCSRLKVGDEVWADIGAVVKLKGSGSRTKELGAYAQYALAIETQLGMLAEAKEKVGALFTRNGWELLLVSIRL